MGRRHKYSIIWLSVLWGASIFGCATANVWELGVADQALQSARESQAPKYAPQEYKDAEDTINKGHERTNEINGEDDARMLAILGANKANYARAMSQEKQQEERQNLLKAQIAAAQKDLENAKTLSDKVKQELESNKSNTPQ